MSTSSLPSRPTMVSRKGPELGKDAYCRNLDSSSEKGSELTARVLKWSIEDIRNSKLFKKQVGVIPMEFSSTAEYLRVFTVPLLEEFRAQLHQAVDKNISQSAGHVIFPAEVKVKRAKKLALKLDLHLSSSVRVKPSDIILLCSERPKWNPKRECIEINKSHEFVLACVASEGGDSPIISANVYAEGESRLLEMLLTSSGWHVLLLGMSFIPAERIWNSINKPFTKIGLPSKMSVPQTILKIERQIVPTGISALNLPQSLGGAETLRRVEDYSNSRGLNTSQRDALKSVLAALLTEEVKPHVRMVQGPPGTGKTSMLVTLISVLGCLRYRTLISAPTNAAVIEISKRIMRFFEVPKKEEIQQETFSGFCSRNSKLPGSVKPIEISAVVLLGSEERLQGVVDGTLLQNVFLPYRVGRLMAALSPTTGWNGYVQSVEKFLTNAPAQFKSKHLKPMVEGRRSTKKSMKQKQLASNASFWSFARESMIELQVGLEKNSYVLTTELPQCHIDPETSKTMTSASNLMANLVELMPSEAPAKAASWFTTTTIDTLSDMFTNLNLSSDSSENRKLKFLKAREALLNALKLRPGWLLMVSKKNPQGRGPPPGLLKSEILKNATLVFSTVSGAGSPQMTNLAFECAIIDEATQLVEAETTIVTRNIGLKQLILVGDHKQLPATVISKVGENCGYGRSLFERLQALQHGCRHMLNKQYRMKPAISHFPNSQFYDGEVKDGPNVLSPEYGMNLENASPFGAYAFLDCKSGAEVAPRGHKGWKNPKEVEIVTSLVTALGTVCAVRNIKNLSVGVISPYAMQVEALMRSLNRQALNEALDVQVKTVDGFQGNERDVIIFSAVRANGAAKTIGFVKDCRRLNVAITRGRHYVWIVGNAKTLSKGAEIWKTLISDAKARNCFHILQD